MTASPLGTGRLGPVKAVAPWRACLSSCLESLPIHPQAVEVEPVRETEADGVYPPTPAPREGAQPITQLPPGALSSGPEIGWGMQSEARRERA